MPERVHGSTQPGVSMLSMSMIRKAPGVHEKSSAGGRFSRAGGVICSPGQLGHGRLAQLVRAWC